MNTCSLIEITTKDNLIHQGIFAELSKKSTTALLWVHGLGSNFYSNATRMNSMIDVCCKNGIAFVSFNTRGHDVVTGIKKIDVKNGNKQTRVLAGSANERFEECVYDIDAGITFLREKGYKKIILAGNSTGANKVCFYAGTQNDPRVSGVVLASPVCDHLVPVPHVSWLTIVFLKTLRVVGLGNTFIPFTSSYPMTPNRALSLMTHSSEDVFDYDDSDRGLKVFRNIIKPLFILLGEQDEMLDRPAFVIKSVYDKKTSSKHYASVIFSDADHGFKGKEKEFVNEIVKFVEQI